MSRHDLLTVDALCRLDAWQLFARLDAVLDPFKVGASYGRGHVDRLYPSGGASRAVSALAIRSKNAANADDVAHALRDAHRRALTFGAAAGGLSEGALLLALVREALPTADTDGARAVETFSVLLGDALSITPNATVRSGGWPFYAWRDASRESVAELFTAAIKIEGVNK